MKYDEVKAIIEKEGLKRFNLYGDHALKENEVAIKFENHQWVVFVTDERASVVSGSVTKFDNESDALDNFVKRLRTEKILFQ